MKIFILSQCKNATTSLYHAISALTNTKTYDWLGKDIISRGEYNWKYIWKQCEKYNLNHDDPFPFIYKEVYQRYPNAKYILTYRDTDEWLESFSDGFEEAWRKKYVVKQFLYQSPYFDKDLLKKVYRQTNQDILAFATEHIPAENFLHFDIQKLKDSRDKDNWNRLGNFLECEVPSKLLSSPFPIKRVRKK